MFENIKYNQILNLIKIVCQVKDHNLDFIQTKYLSDSENFDNVLDLLTKIQVITTTNKKIYPDNFLNRNPIQNKLNEVTLKKYLIEKLLNSKCLYSREIVRYLGNFKLQNNYYQYNPSTNIRLKESDIRNLLIELDLVSYDSQLNIYKINQKYNDLYQKLDFTFHKCISLKSLNLSLRKQAEIGKKAEYAILEFEKMNLKTYPKLIENIEHTSQKDVQAGYDIKSWSVGNKPDKTLCKYIEVKAVSENNYEFKWTRNEINSSKKYKDQYYLYLLPCSNNKFDFSALKIIQNPYNEIFGDKKYWEKQIEEYSIWKIN